MSKREDLTGLKFNMLTAISIHSIIRGRVRWLCKCECGAESIVIADNLKRGHTFGCGEHSRVTSPKKTEHASYQVWVEMKRRCHDEKSTNYYKYGAKGITVCSEWNDFWKFAEDMGDRPSNSHQLDRKNNSEGYSKQNCRWVTPGENSRNREFVKLTDKSAIEIKRLFKDGLSNILIAKKFDVSRDCINDIRTGRRWNHVNDGVMPGEIGQ